LFNFFLKCGLGKNGWTC